MMLNPDDVVYKILEFFNVANAFTTTAIGNGATYQWKEIVYLIVPNLALAIGLVFMGLGMFQKKDLK